uniref:Uncharacterized protein n=1 Tax=Romanomermis culicivorax TaxID=13658 RepID=A0A915KST8_ROMCU
MFLKRQGSVRGSSGDEEKTCEEMNNKLMVIFMMDRFKITIDKKLRFIKSGLPLIINIIRSDIMHCIVKSSQKSAMQYWLTEGKTWPLFHKIALR